MEAASNIFVCAVVISMSARIDIVIVRKEVHLGSIHLAYKFKAIFLTGFIEEEHKKIKDYTY